MANEVLIPVKYVVDGSDLDKAARQLGVVASEERKLADEMREVEAAARKQAAEVAKGANTSSGAIQRQLGILEALESEYRDLQQAQAQAFKTDDIKKYSAQIESNRNKVKELTAVHQQQIGILNKLESEYKQLSDARMRAENPADLKRLNVELENNRKKVKELTTETKQEYSMLGNSIGSIGGMIAGAFAVSSLLSFGKEVLNITAEFQRLKAVLASSLGSESAAQRAFDRITDFAAKTPYSIQQITDSFVRLAGRGIQLTNNQMTAMGDTAASLGKDMGQLTEAVLDVNNTERWTELGIKVKTEGDKISGTFRGMTVEVDRTEAGALKMVEAFGKMEGVAGTMEKVSATVGGALSNLSDNWSTFLANIGNQSSGIIKGAVDDMNGFLSVMNKLASGGYTNYGKEFRETFEQVGAGIDGLKSADEAATKIQTLKINASVLRDEMADLREAIKENEAATLRSINPYKEFSAQTARLSDKKIELKGNLEKLKGQYDAYIKAIETAKDKQKEFEKETGKDAPKELGRIEQIRLKMKEITEQRDTQVGLSQKQADKYNITLAILQEELDTLTKFKREKVELSKLDADEAGLTKVNSEKKLKILTDEAAEEKAIREKSSRDLYEELDARAAYERRLREETIGFAIFAANAYATYQSDRTAERIQNLQDASEREQQLAGDNAQAKELIEKEYNQRIQAERVKQAKLEQNMALFQIAVDTASSIIKTGSELGYPAAIPFQIMAGVTGAIQAALVKSQPIPRFAKGTRSVMGGTPGEDSVLAMLMPQERIITADQNRKLTPAFDVLTDSKRSPQFWNKTLMEIEKLGMFTPPKLLNMPGGGMGGSIDTDRIVNAVKGIVIEKTYFDERGVVRFTEREGNRIRKLNRHYGF